MKKIRELFKSRVGKLVVYLLLAYPVFAAAQIGYRYVRGTGTPGTAACWDSAFVLEDCSGSSVIGGSGTATFIPKFSDANTLTNSSFSENGTTAGNGGTLSSLSATVTAMDGSDQIDVFALLFTNANHTGTGNIVNLFSTSAAVGDANSNLNGLFIGALTGTAGAAGELENAIKIGTGWDNDIYFSDTTPVINATLGTLTIDGDINLGTNDVDDIVINGPVTFNVIHEEFDWQAHVCRASSFGVCSFSDTADNVLIMPMSVIGMVGFSPEQVFSGTFTPFSSAGQLDVSSMVDVTSQDGIDLTFGGLIVSNSTSTGTATLFDEDNSSSTYCEVNVTITTVANIDHMHLFWRNTGARPDPGAIPDNADTWAAIVISDNAGDIDIETELNAGGILNDDTGITWTNGQTKTLRVTLLADTVSFSIDGTPVLQTNAILNLDNGDRMQCGFGMKQSAAGANAGVFINYVEIGISQ